MFSEQEKIYILNLAKRSIEYFLINSRKLVLDEKELKLVPVKLLELKSCFVTLKITGELRGCIGHLEVTNPLYIDIMENAYGAAFADPRFEELEKEELEKIEIEVSVLTQPSELIFSSPNELLSGIRPNIDGVILEKGDKGATYLPQVWEEFSNKEEFLASLCIKAGLVADCWKQPGIKVQVYQVEVIS